MSIISIRAGICTWLCLWINLAFPQSYTLSGYLSDASSGEILESGTIQVPKLGKGAYTNNYGFFSLTLPEGTYQVVSSYIGYVADTQTVVLNRDLSLKIRLDEQVTSVDEVVINASDNAYRDEVKSPQMSRINLKVKDLKLIPTLGGEADVMKVIQLLPGVSKGGEGTTSILVRGGDPDQNLILLDESVVYNVSHLFGFFSVFNPDALKSMSLIKGGFPAQYGGRLSSVIDLNMNEGNLQSYHVKGGIGLLSSRLTVEGPIKKNVASFSLSGRRTYIDRVFSLVDVTVPYYFYDVNAKANVKIGERDRLFFSTYLGDDVLFTPEFDADSTEEELNLDTDFGFRLGNLTSTLRWNHLFNERLFSNTAATFTRFKYDIEGRVGENGLFIGSQVIDMGLKSDLTFYQSPEQTFRFGGQYIRHLFRPNVISAQGDVSQFIDNSEVIPLFSHEWAIYGQHEWQFSDRLKGQYGLRITGAFVPERAYAGLEPRASFVYTLGEKNSLKAGYSRMRQYMHLVSSSTVALPTDLWYPVTKDVKPQSAHQLAGSFTRHFERLHTLFTVEAYYKWMSNLTEYREGANLILNNNFEEQLLQGDGQAYGLEFLFKRDEGKLKGWLSYTLAFSQRQFEDLNAGEPYWAKYDRRHDLSAVGIWEFSKRWTLSAVYTYLSGARFTPQVGQYLYPNPSLTGVEIVPIYAQRNSTRLTAANRLDLNLVLKNKPHKRFRSEWNFGCYNVLNAPTPFRVNINFSPDRGLFYTQPSFLGRVPSIAWNFEW
ncbi:MAG: TonB-dependent receptor [Bacteroidota bacterium]